jgi:hypothetical protein
MQEVTKYSRLDTGFGITFNGVNSYDELGLQVIERAITTPDKRKIQVKIPYRNSTIDFSYLYSTNNTYSDREMAYKFLMKSNNFNELPSIRIRVENFFMNTIGKKELISHDLPNLYFLAECRQIDFEEFTRFGIITVHFNAYPFRIGRFYEGSRFTWDEFNFKLDALQETIFEVNGRYEGINIVNVGATSVVPTIVCQRSMRMYLNGVEYRLEAGENKNHRINLMVGNNEIELIGFGRVEFLFRKELI